MALEYTLMIESKLNLIEVKNILPKNQDLPGITIDIELTDKEDKSFAQDQFRFTPSLSLFFIQDKIAD